MGFNSGFKGLIYFVIELFGRVSGWLVQSRFVCLSMHSAEWANSSITNYINWHQYCNFSEGQTASSLMMV